MMGYHTAGTHGAGPPCQPPRAAYRLGVSCPPSVTLPLAGGGGGVEGVSSAAEM